MAKNKQKPQRARVLGGFTLDGIEYKPNDVIESDPKLIASLSGSVDPSDEAVEHCLNELDVTIKKHPCSEKKAPADPDPDADADPDADPDTDPGDPNTEQPSA